MKVADHILARYWLPLGESILKRHLTTILISFVITLALHFVGFLSLEFTIGVLVAVVFCMVVGTSLARLRFGDSNPNECNLRAKPKKVEGK